MSVGVSGEWPQLPIHFDNGCVGVGTERPVPRDMPRHGLNTKVAGLSLCYLPAGSYRCEVSDSIFIWIIMEGLLFGNHITMIVG